MEISLPLRNAIEVADVQERARHPMRPTAYRHLIVDLRLQGQTMFAELKTTEQSIAVTLLPIMASTLARAEIALASEPEHAGLREEIAQVLLAVRGDCRAA